ncbi:MAG: TetR/AcrR family transcriptional regulator [Renibacterium salmoninarum]|nr:TetR/AcrR family transcriptional regulator [Renibacterium salmoninarum]
MQERALATRSLILLGAARVFNQFGFNGSNLALAAEEAKVTKGAVYFHFSSKLELAKAVIAEQHRLVQEKIAENNRDEQRALAVMIASCQEFANLLQTDTVVKAGIRLTFEGPAFGLDVAGPYIDWIADMTQLALTAKEQGDINPDVDAKAFAMFLVGSFTGVQMVSEIISDRRELSKEIKNMWWSIGNTVFSEKARSDARISTLIEGPLEPLTPPEMA